MQKSSDSEPRIAVVFGGYGGVGRQLCHTLGAEGYRVAVAGRNLATCQEVADEVSGAAYAVDASDVDGVLEVLRDVEQAWGGVHAVANCVGSLFLKPSHRTSPEQWSDVINTNLTSAFAVLRGSAVVMKSGGSVVLTSSVAARLGLANHEAIAAAKAGVEGLVRSGAATYAGKGIRVNAVAPGLVRTAMTEAITANTASLAATEAMHPLGRIGCPEEIARAMAWLLNPSNDWITGQVVSIDGGMSTVQVKPRVSRAPAAKSV